LPTVNWKSWIHIGMKPKSYNDQMNFIRNNFVVLFLYLILLSTALYFIQSYEKNAIHIYLNNFVGNKYLNAFFYYITYLGDGRFAAFMLLVIFILNVRTGLYVTFSFLSSTLVSTTLKFFFFDDVNRPHFVFKWIDKYPLKMVEGVDVHIHNSFPSGHATQVFGILMCLILVSNNRYLKLVLFMLALFTSLSRVYLSQHWLVDITAGSFIGLTFSLLYYFIFIQKNKFARLDKPISDFRKT
jgi:membrane-associated phospholipid phosphatase